MEIDTCSQSVDLYLGGDLGHWVLNQIDCTAIKQVLTLDPDLAAFARTLGLVVWVGSANDLKFCPARTGFSIHYPKILKPALINRYQKIYNLHPGYLPWGKGYYPIFWALWENTPAGATLHELTEQVDQGPIVDQIEVAYDESDTGESLWRRVRQAEQKLFHTYGSAICQGYDPPAAPQPPGGTYHKRQEFFQLKQATNWRRMDGYDLIRLIRCLSFPGYSGLEVSLGGKQFAVHLECLHEAEQPDETED